MVAINPSNVLLLPGWQNSGPAHWQSRWEALHGYQRVEQHNWTRPLRGDWSVQLEAAVRDAPDPVLIVAHSLGCILTAWWAAHTGCAHKVRAALLVAPGDVEREDLAQQIIGWAPIARQRLPFPALLLGSQNDPYCSLERARGMAQDWGAQFVDCGALGHINTESNLGDWAEGHAWLESLACTPAP